MKKLLLITICAFLLTPAISHASFVSTTATNRVTSGLVGYWTFDGKDVVNGVVRDMSGQGNNGNTGSIASTTFYTPGKIGQGGNFDGVNDYVDAGTSSTFNFTSGNFSISMWIKSYTSATKYLLARGANVVDGWEMFRETSRIKFRTYQSGVSQESASATMSENVWYHVVVVRTGANVRIFLNGIDNTTTAAVHTDPATASRTLAIGARSTLNANWSGIIDDVRIYTAALATSSITALYQAGSEGTKANTTVRSRTNLTTGLMGHWTFDGKDIVTGVVRDVSGNSIHGNPRTIATSTFYVTGKLGQGVKFNGTGAANIGVGMGNNLNQTTNDFSISFWYKGISGNITTSFLMGKINDAGTGAGYKILHINSANGLTFMASDGVNTDSFSYAPTNLDNGQWHHLVFTWVRTGSPVLFVDGAANACFSSCTSPLWDTIGTVTNSDNFTIGARSSLNGLFFVGSVDDVRVYNYSLSTSTVTALYNLGASTVNKTVTTRTTTSGLVGYWTFDGPDTLGGVVRDSSGNSNSGNPINIATTTFYTPGKIGQAVKFDAVDDGINAGSLSVVDDLSALSVSLWAKPISYGGGSLGYFVNKSNGGAASGWVFQEFVTSATVRFVAAFDGGTNLTVTAAASTMPSSQFNTWMHFTVTWDGSNSASNVHIYKNGVEVAYSVQTDGVGSRTTDAAQNLFVGNNTVAGPTRSFGGTLDDVRIYNRVLSAAEITTIYNSSK